MFDRILHYPSIMSHFGGWVRVIAKRQQSEMKPLALPLPLRPISIFPNPSYPLFFYQPKPLPQPRIFRVLCSSLQSKPVSFSQSTLSLSLSLCVQLLQYRFYMTIYTNFQVKVEDAASSSKPEYKPGFLDHLFLNLFRNKLVQVDFLYLSQPCHMHILVIYFLLFYFYMLNSKPALFQKKLKKKILWF